jgi:hypothetical protein
MKPAEKIVNGKRCVFSPGAQKWVPVIEKDAPDQKPTRRQREFDNNPRVMMSLQPTARLAKAIKSPEIFIWVYLHYLAWKAKNNTFAVPNTDLTIYGISKQAKHRALDAFEAAGELTQHKNGNRAVSVTLKHPTA